MPDLKHDLKKAVHKVYPGANIELMVLQRYQFIDALGSSKRI